MQMERVLLLRGTVDARRGVVAVEGVCSVVLQDDVDDVAMLQCDSSLEADCRVCGDGALSQLKDTAS